MKGKLKNKDNNWYVTHIMDDNGVKFGVDYPLSIDDIKEIEADSKIFDNIEARISAYPDCEFEIITIDNGDNGIRYAKLIKTEYPELKETMNLCTDIINKKKKTGKMTEEEWQEAEKQK